MGTYYERGTALGELERQMMTPPNFTPRGYGRAVLCRYQLRTGDIECTDCFRYRSQRLACLYLSQRLKAGTVTVKELMIETVRPWKHLRLKQRAVNLACQASGFHFEGQLHIMRMLEMTKGEKENVNSQWLAVYLLSASAALWQKTLRAVTPDQICFANVRLGNTTIQDYVLYRAAKGFCSGRLGTTSDELADPELVSDDTLLLILSAAVIVRYGPAVMNMGRTGKCS